MKRIISRFTLTKHLCLASMSQPHGQNTPTCHSGLETLKTAAKELLAASKAVRKAHGTWSDSEDADLVGFPFHRVDHRLDKAIKQLEAVNPIGAANPFRP